MLTEAKKGANNFDEIFQVVVKRSGDSGGSIWRIDGLYLGIDRLILIEKSKTVWSNVS